MQINEAEWKTSFVDYEKLSDSLNAIARVPAGSAANKQFAESNFLVEFQNQMGTVDQFYSSHVQRSTQEFQVVDQSMAADKMVDSLNFLSNKLQKLLGFVRMNLLAFNRILKRVQASMGMNVYQRTYVVQTAARFYGSADLVSLFYRVQSKLAHLQSTSLDAADFHCTLCSNLVTKPIALSCGHFFCQSCLAAFFLKSKNKECPNNECGRPQIIDPSSPLCKVNTSIANMLQLVRTREAEKQLAVAKGTPLMMPNLVAGPTSSASSAGLGINGMTSLNSAGSSSLLHSAANLPVTTPVVLGRGGSTFQRLMATTAMTGLGTLQQQNQLTLSLGTGGSLQEQPLFTFDQSKRPDLTLALTSEEGGPPMLHHTGSSVGGDANSSSSSSDARLPLKHTGQSESSNSSGGNNNSSMYVSMDDCVQPPLLKSLSPPQPSRVDSRTDRPPQPQRFDSTGLPYLAQRMNSLGVPPRGFPGKPRRQRSNSEERNTSPLPFRTSAFPFRGNSPPPAFGPRQRSRSDPSIEFNRSFSTNMNVRMDSTSSYIMDVGFESIFNLQSSSIMDPPPPPGLSAYSDEPHTLHERELHELFPPAQAPMSPYPTAMMTSDSGGSGSGSSISNTKNLLSPSMYTTPMNSRLSPRNKKTTPPNSTSSKLASTSKSNDANKQTQAINLAPFNPPSTIRNSTAVAAASSSSSGSSSGGGPPMLQHSRTQLMTSTDPGDEDMPASSGDSLEIPLPLDDPPALSGASNSSTSTAAAVSGGNTAMLSSGGLLLDGSTNSSPGNLTFDSQTPPLLHRSASSLRRRASSMSSVPTDRTFLAAFAAPNEYQLQTSCGMLGGSAGLLQSTDHLGNFSNIPMNTPHLISTNSCPMPSPHERPLMMSPSQAPAPLTLNTGATSTTAAHSLSLPAGFSHPHQQLVQTPSHQLRHQLQNLSIRSSHSEPFVGAASTAAGANGAASTAPLALGVSSSSTSAAGGGFPHLGTDFSPSSASSFSSDPVTSQDPPIPKALRVACVHCHKSKTACDGHRPCARCVRMHRGDSCTDRVPKKRGRPHKLPSTVLRTDAGTSLAGTDEANNASHLGASSGDVHIDMVLNDLQSPKRRRMSEMFDELAQLMTQQRLLKAAMLNDPLSSLSSSSATATPTLSSAPVSLRRADATAAGAVGQRHLVEVDLNPYPTSASSTHELSSLPTMLPSYMRSHPNNTAASDLQHGGRPPGGLDLGGTGGFFSAPTNGVNAFGGGSISMFNFSAASNAAAGGGGAAAGGFDPFMDPLAASTDLPPIA